ncbi:MAG: hypothetical protein MR971_07605, partial [Bacteroidales bacterium]|nr:hypothetical protein [Bacteroidales bacterium]
KKNIYRGKTALFLALPWLVSENGLLLHRFSPRPLSGCRVPRYAGAGRTTITLIIHSRKWQI